MTTKVFLMLKISTLTLRQKPKINISLQFVLTYNSYHFPKINHLLKIDLNYQNIYLKLKQ